MEQDPVSEGASVKTRWITNPLVYTSTEGLRKYMDASVLDLHVVFFQVAYYDDDDSSEGGELEKMTIQIKEVVDDIDENIKEALKEGGVTKSIEAEFTTVKDLTLDAIKKQDRKLRQMDRKLEELSVLMNELLNRTTLDPNRLANLPPPSALSRNFDAKQNSTEAPSQEEQIGRNSKRLKARKPKNAPTS